MNSLRQKLFIKTYKIKEHEKKKELGEQKKGKGKVKFILLWRNQ